MIVTPGYKNQIIALLARSLRISPLNTIRKLEMRKISPFFNLKKGGKNNRIKRYGITLQQSEKRKEDYVFTGQIVIRLPELVTHCPTEVDQFVWFSGGILFWLIHWRS